MKLKKIIIKELSNLTHISNITPDDNDEVVDLLYSVFGGFGYSKEELKKRITPRLNNNISIKIKEGDKIVGVYLFNEKSINKFIDEIKEDKVTDFRLDDTKITLNEEISDNGLQGIALAVLPSYKGLGYGNKLKEYSYNMGYDYIWGVQDKKLNNIDFWLNSRNIFAESSNRYATYIKL